jgi:hypothetical protein
MGTCANPQSSLGNTTRWWGNGDDHDYDEYATEWWWRWCPGLKYRSGDDDQCPSTSSLSRSLSKVIFLWVRMSLNVGSHIHLHRVEAFDEATSVAHGMSWLYPYQCPLKYLEVGNQLLLWWPSPMCENNNYLVFNVFQSTYLFPKMVAPLIVSINTFHSRILLKTNTKGVREHGIILKS